MSKLSELPVGDVWNNLDKFAIDTEIKSRSTLFCDTAENDGKIPKGPSCPSNHRRRPPVMSAFTLQLPPSTKDPTRTRSHDNKIHMSMLVQIFYFLL